MTTTIVAERLDQVSTGGPLGNPAEWVDVSTHATEVAPWSDVVIGQKNPGWKDKIKAGTDASSYYKRTGTTLSILPLLGESRGSADWPRDARGTFAGALFSSHPPFQPTDDVVRDQALQRVKRRIASLEESYQALIPLAELREARSLFRQMIDNTNDMVKAVADLKRTKGRSLFRYVQDRWLMYSFGIRPMMSDLNSLGNSIWAFLTKGDVRDRVQGTAGKDWFSSSLSDGITGMTGWPIRAVGYSEHKLSYRYAAGWKFLIRSSNDYTALNHFGLNLPALVPALWETTMYSWVVDYFTTAGDWLEDIFVGSSGQSLYVVENRKYQYRSTLTLEHYAGLPAGWAYLATHRKGRVVLEYFEFERTPLVALPTRTLRFKTVDEIGRNALTKLLNLVALLR